MMLQRMLFSFITLASILVGTLSSQPPTFVGGDAQRYSEVTRIDTCTNSITVPNGFAYRPGDRVMLVQMKGATIDTNESPFAGQPLSANNVGLYQLNTVTGSDVSSVTMRNPIDAGFDVANHVQCIRIVSGRSLRTNAPLEVQPWNGGSGGILVIECSDTLFLNHDIGVRGSGFRGGASSRNTADSNITQMFLDADDGRGGFKGEGPVRLPSRRACGKAPAISGGGGGNAGNGGGGGGAMVSRGGTGGRQTTEYSRFDAGGIGGYPLLLDHTTLRLILGSGGGGGHQNDFLGGKGGNGGGLVLISAKAIVGTGARRIDARGLAGDSTRGDGAGGGGSGGMVILDVDTIVGNVTVDVRGGEGGMAFPFGLACYAPGGGGGGGLIGIPVNRRLLSGNFFSNLDFGSNGQNQPELFQCFGERHLDATSGQIGEIVIVGPLRQSRDTVLRPVLVPRDTLICPNEFVIATVTNATSVRWSPSGLVENPTSFTTRTVPIISDTFIVAAMSVRGQCEVFDTLRIRVRPRQDSTLVAGPRGPCIGQPVSYSLPIATADIPRWNVSSTFGTRSYTASTIDTTWSNVGIVRLSVSFTDTSGCPQQIQLDVTVSDSLTPLIRGLRPLCLGDSLELDAGEGFDSYLWSNGSTSRTTVIRDSGQISVSVSSTNGCQGSAMATVRPGRTPTPRLSAPRVDLESINDAITISASDVGQSIEWSDGSTGATLTVRRGGRYWAVVTSEDGCLGSSDTITINSYRKGAPIQMAVDDIRYRPGQNVVLTLRVISTERRLENIDVTVQLQTNGTCIVPVPSGQLDGSIPGRITDFAVNRTAGTINTTIALTIDSTFIGEATVDVPAIGALGNQTSSALRVTDCSTTTDVTDCLVLREGTATNEDVCQEGGDRLFDGTTLPTGVTVEGGALTWSASASRRVFAIDALGRQLELFEQRSGNAVTSRAVHQPAIMWWLIHDGAGQFVVPVIRR